ncbi:MAG: helix-turn-helix domain-containing protein [Lachnospiraceae bacterium]
MAEYIENLNAYITHMKIKQTYISRKTGINTSTLSRILNESREVNISEMEKITQALGKKAEFFMNEEFTLPAYPQDDAHKVVFYAGEPTKRQEEFALHLLEMLDNAEEVLGAKGRFMMTTGE